ncbi:MAG: sugar transferase [Desulfobacteraceae bacterium]|nr:MAG: sugar transferase [Desulfobacteraceae bacterium]
MLRFVKQYFPIRNVMFIILEGEVIIVSFILVSILFSFFTSFEFDVLLFLRIVLVMIVCQTCLYYNDLYDFTMVKTLPVMIVKLLESLGVTSIVLAVVYLVFPVTTINHLVFVLSILLLIVFITSWRLAYLNILDKGLFNEGIIIVGSNPLSMEIMEKIQNTIDCGYHIKAFFPYTDHDVSHKIKPLEIKLITDIKDLCDVAVSNQVKKIVTVMKEQRGSFPMKELIECRTVGIEIIDGCSFYEHLSGKVLADKINPSWLVFSDGFKKSSVRNLIKRTEDIVGSLIALILLSPVIIITAILVKLDSPGPVLFAQDRVGRHKKEFIMHKFRSMVADAEKMTGPVWANEDDPRITRVGRIIRKYRIDELPQFWDVLMGRMSLVGPRPERKHFTDKLEKDIPFYSQRFLAKPGLTGWAQVSYSYGATVDDALEKLNYDLFYIKNMSTTFDLVIIFRTVKIVIFGRGAR